MKKDVNEKPMNIPKVGHVCKTVIQTDFSLWDPKVSAQTGVKIVINTSKNPASNLIDKPSSKFLVYANIISVIAEKTRLIDRIDLI